MAISLLDCVLLAPRLEAERTEPAPAARVLTNADSYARGRKEYLMKLEWHKPAVVEQEVGLEVTSYASAELGH
jgi:coenzyme PQQ precursor peptide PqqA